MPETLPIQHNDPFEDMPHDGPQSHEVQEELLPDNQRVTQGIGMVALSEHLDTPKVLAEVAEDLRINREQVGYARAHGQISDSTVDYRLTQPFSHSSELSTAIRAGGYGAAELNAVIKESSAVLAYMKNIDKRPNVTFPDHTEKIIANVPDDILQDTYNSKLDRESGALKHWLSKKLESEDSITGAREVSAVLSRVYGESPSTIQQNEVAMKDPMVRKFVDSEGFLKLVVYELPSAPEPGETSHRFSNRMQTEVYATLVKQVGLSPELSVDYVHTIYHRTRIKNKDGFTLHGEGGGVDMASVKAALSKSLENIKAVGAENIALIREKCGIRNYDNYTASQLQRMVRFANSDPKELEHLRAGDVTVLFGDGSGDHNHANKSSAKDFDTESERTLFFEINRPSDLYRHMKSMKDRDVAPSTLVWAAHGSPGAMHMGSGRNGEGFIISNHDVAISQENTKLYQKPVVSIEGAKGLQRIATEYMQSSRGIDDDDAAVGRRRIILKSCSQAKTRPAFRTQEDGQSFWVDESTVETVAHAINDPKVDVYGASEVASIKTTDKGFEYTDMSDKNNTIPLAATKVTIGLDGKPRTEKVAEVILRK